MALNLNNYQVEQLISYLDLLVRWNKSYNLTSVREPETMVTRHLLDSLSLMPFIDKVRYLDVGSGAGLPGIPLAIAFPNSHFDLLDSNGKKTRFLFQVKIALGLDNVEVHHSRVEHFTPTDPYDVVLSRAYSSLAQFVQGCSHLVIPGGQWFAMKGEMPNEELRELPDDIIMEQGYPLAVPGGGQRHLVVLGRQCTIK